MKIHFHIPLIATLMLSGCSDQSLLTKSNQPLLQPGTGLVVATLGYKIKPAEFLLANYPYIGLKIQDESALNFLNEPALVIDTKGSNLIGFKAKLGGWDELENMITTSDNRRMLVAYAMKPGAYRVGEIVASFPTYGAFYSNHKNPLQFKVKAGEVVYLGSYELNFSTYKDFLGTPRPDNLNISVRDRSSDDIGFLQTLRPEAQPLPVVNALTPAGKP